MPAFTVAVTNTNTSGSIAANFASNNATAILIACIKTGISGNATTISDTAGNTWASAGFIDGATWRQQVWYALDCKFSSGTNTVTVNVALSATNILEIFEYGGVPTSSVVGTEVQNSGSGTSLTSGTITTTAGDMVLAFGFAASNSGVTVGAGYTSRANTSGMMMEEKLTVTTSESPSITAATGNWSMIAINLHNAAPTDAAQSTPASDAGAGVKHQRVVAPAQTSSAGTGSRGSANLGFFF